MMAPVHHLVVHMSDPQKEFLYLDLAVDSYKVDAANSSCNLMLKKENENQLSVNIRKPHL